MAAVDPFRPRWDVRTPAGERLVVEHDRLRQRWRVTPGGYGAVVAVGARAGERHGRGRRLDRASRL